MFHVVCLAWILFRADSFDTALIYLATAGKFVPGIAQASPFTVCLIGLGLAMQFVPEDLPRRIALRLVYWPDWTLAAASGLAVVAIDAMGPDGVAPFIYFQF